MATYGAEPKDLGREIRKIWSAIHELTTPALSRPALRVDDGDFEVTGGGNVVVEDGGAVVVKYRDGSVGVYFGDSANTDTGEYNGVSLLVQQDDGTQVFSSSGATLDGESNTQLWRRNGTGVKVEFDGDTVIGSDVDTVIGSDDDTYIQPARDATMVAGRDVTFQCGDERDFFVYNMNETTASANLAIVGAGRWRIHTSKRANKLDIEDIDLADAALRMRPRSWVDRTEKELDDDYDTRTVGFVAEEMGEDCPELVTYSEAGEPYSIAYDRVPAALVALCQAQQRQIDDLTKRIEAQEADS